MSVTLSFVQLSSQRWTKVHKKLITYICSINENGPVNVRNFTHVIMLVIILVSDTESVKIVG